MLVDAKAHRFLSQRSLPKMASRARALVLVLGCSNPVHVQAIIQVVFSSGHIVALSPGHPPLVLCALDDEGIVPLEGQLHACHAMPCYLDFACMHAEHVVDLSQAIQAPPKPQASAIQCTALHLPELTIVCMARVLSLTASCGVTRWKRRLSAMSSEWKRVVLPSPYAIVTCLTACKFV